MPKENSPKQPDSLETKGRKPLCFVIAPIGIKGSDTRKQSDVALRYIIQPALDQVYNVKRADEDSNSGEITRQMILDIENAELVVCNLSGLNANVMYELGVAHSRGKKVIHIYDKKTQLPFDIRQSRSIEFDVDDPDSHSTAVEDLRRFERSLSDKSTVSNPFTDAMAGPVKFDQEDLKNQTVTALLADFEEMFDRVESIERRLRIAPAIGETSNDHEQVDAAAKVIELLADRPGYERVTIDTKNGRKRLIVFGERQLDTSEIPEEINGVRVEFRLK